MANAGRHVHSCPECQGTEFREEKIVQLDASVVIREDLQVPAQVIAERYRYICMNCNHVLNQPWSRNQAK